MRLVWLDQHTGRCLAQLVAWAEKKWFGGWDDMHKMRFDQPEEDDGFFVYTFVTEAIFLLFLHVDELWEAGFQDALASRDRAAKLMRYYRSCLQRQLYANGPGQDPALQSHPILRRGGVAARRIPRCPVHHHHPASLQIGGLACERVLPGLAGALARSCRRIRRCRKPTRGWRSDGFSTCSSSARR